MKKRLTQKLLDERIDEVNFEEEKKEELKQVIEDLKESLEARTDTSSLTASQIGYDKRMFAMKFDKGITVFINPMIAKSFNAVLARQTDINDKKEYILPRASKILLYYQDEEGKMNFVQLEQEASFMACYMNDILNGVRLSDVGLEVIDEFDKASKEEQQEVINMYLKSLKDKEKMIQTEIDNDKDAKELQKGINYMTNVFMNADAKSNMNRSQKRNLVKLERKYSK